MSKRPPLIRCMNEALESPPQGCAQIFKRPPNQIQEEEMQMRVLVLAKEGEQSKAPTAPTPEAMAEHETFNGELVKAGVVVAAGRLSPSSQGKRVQFGGKKRRGIDGPFAEAQERVAGDRRL